MKLNEFIEVQELDEGAKRQMKRVGNNIKKRYRCPSGKKKGKLVKSPADCAKRKDPKKVRRGKKVMRSKKGIIARKSQITKRKAISKLIQRMNNRLAGKKNR